MDNRLSKMQKNKIIEELETISELNNDHFMKFYESFIDTNTTYLVFEYCEVKT